MSQANSEAIFQQAHDLYNNGKHNEALVIFDQHLEMKKDEFDIYQKTRCFFLNLKKYEQAVEIFDKILEKNPKDAEILYNKGYALERSGENDKSKPYYFKALSLDENNFDDLQNLGLHLIHYLGGNKSLDISKLNSKSEDIIVKTAIQLIENTKK